MNSSHKQHRYKENNKSAVVLLSGGQDSTTALMWAVQNFTHVGCLSINYGQKHEVELRCAEVVAHLFSCNHHIIDMQNTLNGSALTEHDKDINASHPRNADLPASFVPGRNMMFLTIAAAYAYNAGLDNVVTGVCQTDYSGYPDCRAEFLVSCETAAQQAMDFPHLQIHAPILNLTKAETWKLARDLGGDNYVQIIVNDTHTDYNGDRSQLNDWGWGKLDNPASKIRAQGFKEAKEKGWI